MLRYLSDDGQIICQPCYRELARKALDEGNRQLMIDLDYLQRTNNVYGPYVGNDPCDCCGRTLDDDASCRPACHCGLLVASCACRCVCQHRDCHGACPTTPSETVNGSYYCERCAMYMRLAQCIESKDSNA